MSTPHPGGRDDAAPVAVQQKLLSKLTDPRWYWVLLPAGIAVFLVGCWGYLSYEGGTQSVSDAAYGSIKLFFLHAAPQPETHVGVALNLARFLAPVVAGWAALIAVVSVLWDRMQRLLIPLKRGHVVVCGLGYVGFEFLRQLRNEGYRVVVVEADGANPQIEACRGWGFPVVVGDAQLRPTLEAAGVKHAARLLAVTRDSVVNTEIVTRARRLAEDHRRSGTRKLRCLARIDDPSLCVLLRTAESNRIAEDPVMDFFSIDEIGARLLLDKHPIGAEGPPHIVVAHLDSLGAGLIFHAARRWHDERKDQRTPLLVTVIDDAAQRQVESLLARYPALEQVCEFRCCAATVHDIDRLAAGYAGPGNTGRLDGAGPPPISRVYVTADHDELTVETALVLRQALPTDVPVVVALSRADAVGDLLEETLTGRAMNLEVFRTLEETCSVELVEGGSFEAIAHEIYRRYCRMQSDGGQPPPPWSQLDEALKEPSRAQARHVGVKLHSIGCEIAPLRYWHARDFRFTHAELDKLTVMEHDRWQRVKEADGWTLGPRDAKRKTHPDLVPWENLPADVADWDRQFVLAIPELLAAVGLQIVDVNKSAPRYPTGRS